MTISRRSFLAAQVAAAGALVENDFHALIGFLKDVEAGRFKPGA